MHWGLKPMPKNATPSDAETDSDLKLSRYIVASPVFQDPHDLKATVVLFSTRTISRIPMEASVWSELLRVGPGLLSEVERDRLLAAKILVRKSENEFNEILAENRDASRLHTTLYLVVQPTADCQLGCDYCGQQHSHSQLSEVHQDAYLERAERKLALGSYKTLEVSWFGGEPLLGIEVIRRMAPRFQRLAERFGCKYTSKIVTNGLALTGRMAKELALGLGVRYAEVTLDGSEEFHDRRRKFKRGSGSFQRILRNIVAVASLEALPLRLGIRCNVDARNREGVVPLLRLLAESEVHRKIERFYVSPVHAWGNDAERNQTSLEEFSAWQMEWFVEMSRLGFQVDLLPGRTKILCMVMRPESDLIDAFGNLFNCTEVSYVPTYEGVGESPSTQGLVSIGRRSAASAEKQSRLNKYAIGHIESQNPDARREVLGEFYDEVAGGAYECGACRMLPTCGGGCPKNWLEGHRPCPPERFNIEERLVLEHFLSRGWTGSGRATPRAEPASA
jgi:uncharacterized protein